MVANLSVNNWAINNPYPEQACNTITDFTYHSDLHLLRLKNASLDRKKKPDADYIVAKDYTISFKLNDDEQMTITVPKGLLTDLVSIPYFLRSIVGRVGPHLEAGIVHDYLYYAWQDIPGYSAKKSDRYFADRLLLEGMKKARFNLFKCYLVYTAIRLFGYHSYKKGDVLPRYHPLP